MSLLPSLLPTEYKGSRQAEDLGFQLLPRPLIGHIQAYSRGREDKVPRRCMHYHSNHKWEMPTVGSLIRLSVYNSALSVLLRHDRSLIGDPGL
jgi:hypothetical protein